MDADTILRIKPALTQYLHQFNDCMGRVTNREHLATYVSGQLSDLDRKSIEPMADAAGRSPRTLQEFLGLLKWDESSVRDRLQQRVAQRYADPNSIGIFDETSYHKQGKQTACVQRQHCGSRGKIENCVVSVHLGYVAGDFHTLLDGELYLPEKTWHEDRQRCRKAGIPDELVYRAKWRIALGQVERTLRNGVRFGWLTFDEYYGGKPPLLWALDALGQNYVAEIPRDFSGWTKAPDVHYRAHARDGQSLTESRKLKVRQTPACRVDDLLRHSPVLRKTPWMKYRIRDGEKGPMVWEAQCIPFWIKDEHGLPSRPHRLIVARNVLNPDEVKFFLSNAPETVPVETLLRVAFSRWHIERMFEDSKTELGLDHFEVRHYRSISRHLILTCVSHLFLAEFWLKHRGKKFRVDGGPTADGHAGAGARLVSRWTLLAPPRGGDRRPARGGPGAQPQGPTVPSQGDHQAPARDGHTFTRPTHMSLVRKVA